MAPPIVVVEDDDEIADLLALYLGRAGHAVERAVDGLGALDAVRAHDPALVVLDVGLPGAVDGLEVCRRLRETSRVPVLVLTARGDEADRVRGFELGADDYVTKPFSPRELVARVTAILRRAAGAAGGAVPSVDGAVPMGTAGGAAVQIEATDGAVGLGASADAHVRVDTGGGAVAPAGPPGDGAPAGGVAGAAVGVARAADTAARVGLPAGAAGTSARVVVVGDVHVDLGRYEARRGGVVVPLAPREFALLATLAEHRGLVLSRRQLLDQAWGWDFDGDERTVDVHVRQLRRKLGAGLPLATLRRAGYRLG